MATRIKLFPVKDITTNTDYIFRIPVFEITETITDRNIYGDVAHLLAQHPTFPPEASWFTNVWESSFYNELGFPAGTWFYWNDFDNHTWQFADGTTGVVEVYGSGNLSGLRVAYNGQNITLVQSENANIYPITSMMYCDGTETSYARIYGKAGEHPVLTFYYNTTYHVDSLPVTRSASEKEIAFWTGKTFNPSSDPYSQGGESEPGGGTGTFDGTSTPIPIPGLPSLSAVDTGFITLFNPSLLQLKNLASYMWSGTFDLNTFKKLFADPMDCILGLSIVPVAVPNGGTQSVMVGNISTGVSMTLAGSQYVTVNCGTINVNEYWGSYLDYAPYSKASIYLPYCGVHPIDIDEIMDRTITVEYHVDILSGACVAFIMCADSVLYSFTGQCASSIPVSGNDFTQMINGIITASTAIGSMVATGGATAPVAVPQLVSTAVNSMKPEVEKSGSLSGTGGMLAIQTPYLILTIPRQALPKDQNTFTGYPSFITSTLGDLSGYTEVEEIHLESVPATDGELSEILNLLKSGVIL